MPEHLTPGVFIEELSTGPRSIEGVSTSTAAFLGVTERGPEHPFLVAGWLEYQRRFGSYLPETVSYLPHAVQGFFDNGGQRLFVARIVGANATFTNRRVGNLLIRSSGRGAWGNRVYIRIRRASTSTDARNPDWVEVALLYYSVAPPDPLIDPLSSDPADRVNPNRREPDYVERFDGLSHVPGTANNIETVINGASHLVRAWFHAAGPGPVPQGEVADFAPLGSDGTDGDLVNADRFTGDLEPIDSSSDRTIEIFGRGRGLAAIATVDDVALLAAPDEIRFPEVTAAVIRQCETLKDRFAIVSTVRGRSEVAGIHPPRDTTYAAFYYPWIEIDHPLTRRPLLMPPTGHITGLIARTDVERGVHKAPANEVVRGATNLEFPVTKAMQDVLNPRGVNCVRDFRADGQGIRVWGARTMSSDPQWKYISVRRLFIFIEQSIDKRTRWVAFEPNDEPLWAQVRRSITNFLVSVWRSDALIGQRADEAFFVKCDRTTMTQDDIDNGRLICEIGIAPVRPAEFVIIRISQKTAVRS